MIFLPLLYSRTFLPKEASTNIIICLRRRRFLNLVGSWPSEDKACLVWYNYPAGLEYFPAGLDYFTFHELQEIANVQLMVRLNDGAIYSMTRK